MKKLSHKKLIAIFFALLMIGSVFGLISAIPSPPQSNSSNNLQPAIPSTSGSPTLSASTTYWHNVGISNSGTTTYTVPYQECDDSLVSFSIPSSDWNLDTSTYTATATYTVGSYDYYQNSQIGGIGLILPAIYAYDGSAYTYYILTASVSITLTASEGGSSTWSHTFNSQISGSHGHIEVYPSWANLGDANYESFTMHITIDGNYNTQLMGTPGLTSTEGYTYSGTSNAVITSSAPSQASQVFATGWYFSHVIAGSFSPTSDLTSYSVAWSSTYNSGAFTTNGQTSSGKISGTLSGSLSSFSWSYNPSKSNPTVNSVVNSVSQWKVSFYLIDQVQAQKTSETQTLSSSQNIAQHQNWYNSSIAYTIANPSGAIDNTALPTTSGTINAGTTATWTVSGIEVCGYGRSPAVDIFSWSGYQSGFASLGSSPPQYESIAESSAQAISTSGLSVSYQITEFLNFYSTISITPSFSGSGSTMSLTLSLGGTISNEPADVCVSWNTGETYEQVETSVLPGSYTVSHNYKSIGQKSITAKVVNLPNYGSSTYDLSATSQPKTYTISVTINPSPVPDSTLLPGQSVSMTYSQSNVIISSVSLAINGQRVVTTDNDGTYSGTSPIIGQLVVNAAWTLSTSTGFSKTLTFVYGAPLIPGSNASFVSIIGSNSATSQYPITITGSPSGTGTYQQEFVINDPSQYGINPSGSNFEISYPDGTPAYSWIQSINSTSLVVWSKLTNGTGTVELQIFPSFINLLSATGYIGEAPQLSPTNAEYDNGIYVFGNIDPDGVLEAFGYENFLGTANGYPAYPEAYVKTPNGLYFSYTNHTGDNYLFASYNSLPIDTNYSIRVSSYGYSPDGTPAQTYFVPIYSNSLEFLNPNGGVNTVLAYMTSGYYNGAYPQGFQSGMVTFYFSYFFSIPYVKMPTISIGSASIFVSNGKQITHQPYEIANPYPFNSTLESYTYAVYDSYQYNYVTIIYNSSWTFEGSSVAYNDSGTIDNGKFLQFDDISGVGTISVWFLQPSQLINTAAYVTLNPEQNNNSIYLDGLHSKITYTDYESTIPHNETVFGTTATLPYGSRATFDLYNQWDQLIGTQTNVLIDSSDGTLTIPVSIATLSFDFVNSTAQPVSLTANGITISGLFASTTVAQNYSYMWTTQAYNLYTGKNQNYSGDINSSDLNKQAYTLAIYTDSPPSALTIIVNAYNDSNQGEIGIPNTPTVYLYIDGLRQPIGSTFIGSVGSTYDIVVTDVLGQMLYSTNLTLETTEETMQADITDASWQFSIQNQELIKSSSPLATEHISLNLTGSHKYYNFTNQVGQTANLYLKQGSYYIYLHDNATFNTSFNLNQNQNYVIFAQNLLTEAEWQKEFNKILNNTSGLEIQTVHSDSELQPGQHADYSFEACFANTTQLTDKQLRDSNIVVQVTNSSGSYALSITQAIANGIVYENFTAPAEGSYTISIVVLYASDIGGRISYTLNTQSITIISKGILLSGSGPSGSISVDKAYNYTITVDYDNGTPMNLQNTEAVYNNMTFTIYNDVDPVQKTTKLAYYAGVITFSATFNSSGIFSIYIETHADFDGKDSATTVIPVLVVAVPPPSISISFTGPTDALIDTTQTFTLTLFGQSVNTSVMLEAYKGSSINIYSGDTLNATISPSSYSSNNIFFSHTFTQSGNYTAVVSLMLNGYLLSKSIYFSASTPSKVSIGMSMSGAGPSSVLLDSVNNYTLSLDYSNGTAMNLASTHSAYENLSFSIYTGTDPVQQITKLNCYAGVITFNALFNLTGSYTIYAFTHENIKGSFAEATTLIPVTVITPTPISNGLHATLIGASSGKTNGTYQYALSFSYLNGSLVPLNILSELNANLSIILINGTTTHSVGTISNNLIYFSVTFKAEDDYQIYVSSHADIPNDASASAIISVIISNVIPAPFSIQLSAYPSELNNSQQVYTVTVFGQDIAALMTSYYRATDLFIYMNGTLLKIIHPISNSSNNIFFSYTPTKTGNYSLVALTYYMGYTESSSQSISVSSPRIVSIGMKISGKGPSNVIVGTLNDYTLSIDYANGTAMNLTDTQRVFNNLTITTYSGTDPIQTVTLLNSYNGIITFSVMFNKAGEYTLYAKSFIDLNGLDEATTLIPTTVNIPAPVSYNIKTDLVGPASYTTGGTANYNAFITFSNGTSLTLSQTALLTSEIDINVIGGKYTTIQTGYSAGRIGFAVTFLQQADYTVVVSVKNSPVNQYPITVVNSPSGNGTYQQEFELSNPSQYGINANASNFLITYSNGTPVYSWIQNYNSSEIVLWSKLNNGTTQVELQIFDSSDSLLSSTGYIGIAPQLTMPYAEYDNGYKVFSGPNTLYDNFKNITDLEAGFGGGTVNGNSTNGLHINNGISGGPDGNNIISLQAYNTGTTSFLWNGYNHNATYFELGYFIAYVNNSFIVSTCGNPARASIGGVGGMDNGVDVYSTSLYWSGTRSPYYSVNTSENFIEYLATNNTPESIVYGNGINALLTGYPVTETPISIQVGIQSNTGIGLINYVAVADISESVMPSTSIGKSSILMGNASSTSVISVIVSNTPTKPFSNTLSAYSNELVDAQQVYTVTIFGENVTQLMPTYFNATTLLVYNGNSLSTTLSPTSMSDNNIFFVYTPSATENYTLVAVTSYAGFTESASKSIHVYSPTIVSIGMKITGVGPANVIVGTSNNYTLSVNYANGNAMNLTDTEKVYNNLNFTIYSGFDPIQKITKITYYAGIITFNAIFNKTGSFSIYAYSSINLNGIAKSSTLIPVNVVAPTPISNGLHSNLVGPSSGKTNGTYLFTVSFTYLSGTNVPESILSELYHNLSVIVINGTTTYKLGGINSGLVYIYITFRAQDDYQVYVTSHADIPNVASSSALASVTITNNPQNSVSIKLTGHTNVIKGTQIVLTATIFGQSVLSYMNQYNSTIKLQIYNGTVLMTTLKPIQYSSNNIFFTYNANIIGNFTAIVLLNVNDTLQSQSLEFSIVPIPIVSIGMTMKGSGPSSIILDQSGNFTLSSNFLNGASFTAIETKWLFANLTFKAYNGNDPVATFTPLYSFTSVMTFSALFSLTGSYSIYALTTAIINNQKVQASTLIPVQVVLPVAISHHITISIEGATKTNTFKTQTYYAFLSYTNGTSLNLSQTASIYRNITLQTLGGNSTITLEGYIAGQITFNISFTTQDDFVIYLRGHANIPENASATAVYSVIASHTIIIITSSPDPTSQIVAVNTTALYNVYFQYSDGSFIPLSIMSAIQTNTTAEIYSGSKLIDTVKTSALSGDFLIFSIKEATGNYTILFKTDYSGVIQSVASLRVSSIPFTVGLSISFGVTNSVLSNSTLIIPVYLYYGNGTRLNLTDTNLVLSYITLYVLQGNLVLNSYAPVNYTAGVVDFKIPPLVSGSYSFDAIVSPLSIAGQTVHATITQAETASPHVLSPFQSFISGISEFVNVIVENLLITIIVAILVIVGTYGLKALIRRINKKLKRDKQDTTYVDNSLVAMATNSMTESPMNAPTDIARRYAMLSAVEQDAFLRVPDGVLKNFSVDYKGKPMTMMEIRQKLVVFNKKENAKSIFSHLRKKEDEKKNTPKPEEDNSNSDNDYSLGFGAR